MAWGSRGLKTQGLFNFLQKARRGFLRDTHRAVALHIGVPAQRAYAGARFTQIAAQHQQIAQRAHVFSAGIVLGDAHAIRDDGGIGFGIGRRDLFQRCAREPAVAFDQRPLGRDQVCFQCFKAVGMCRDKRVIQHFTDTLLKFQYSFHHPFNRCHVTACFDIQVGGGNRC